jgi:hypothetical protein
VFTWYTMSVIHSPATLKPLSHASSKIATIQPEREKPRSWTRAPVGGEKHRALAVSPDKLPPWVTAAARQAAGVFQPYVLAPFDLGVHIGTNIRNYLDNGTLRADIAQMLQNPAVLAAAATVAPRIIGALMLNQAAIGMPQHPEAPPSV